jgi:hypothetical protein
MDILHQTRHFPGFHYLALALIILRNLLPNVSERSTVACHMKQCTRLGQMPIPIQCRNLKTAAAIERSCVEYFTHLDERHGGKWRRGAAFYVQVTGQRSTDPRLLQWVLANVETVPHVEIDTDSRVIDRLDQLRKLVRLVPAYMFQREHDPGIPGLVSYRAEMLTVHRCVVLDLGGILACRQEDRVSSNGVRKRDQ